MSKLIPIGLALAAAAAATAPAHAERASVFLSDAIKGDNGEISNGTLAQQRGGSKGVRNFGAMLVRDHSAAKAQAVAAAKRERVGVPSGMKLEASQLHRRLTGLRGASFDRAFISAMIEDHRKDIAKFEAQAKSGDAITRKLAAQTLPHLREHLRTAQSLK